MKQHFLDNWGQPPTAAPSAALQSLLAALTGAADDLFVPVDTEVSHPVLYAQDVPAAPTELASSDYLSALSDMAADLSDLVEEE